MELSGHALVRAQQRAIPMPEVEFILDNGSWHDMAGLGVGYQLSCRELDQQISGLKSRIRFLERLRGKSAVCSRQDGVVITVQHQTRRWKNAHHNKRRGTYGL